MSVPHVRGKGQQQRQDKQPGFSQQGRKRKAKKVNLFTWVERWVPEEIGKDDPIVKRRAVFTLELAFLMSSLSLALIPVVLPGKLYFTAFMLVVTALGAGATFLLMHHTHSLDWSVRWLLFFYAASVFTNTVVFGPSIPAIASMFIHPMMAVLLSHRISKTFWGFVYVSYAIVVHIPGLQLYHPNKTVDPVTEQIMLGISLGIVFIASLMLIALYESEKQINEEIIKKGHTALQKRERQLKTVLSHAPVALWVCNQDGDVELAEGRNLNLLQKTQLTPQDETPSLLPELIEGLSQALEGKTQQSHLEHKGRYFDVHYAPFTDEENKTSQGALIAAIDITEHHEVERVQKLNKELEKARDLERSASKAKSEFLANMSHELRTPLNAIIGYSEMIAEDIDPAESMELHDDLNRIQTSGKHLLSLINDLLDLSKIEAGRVELYPEAFTLTPFLESLLTTVTPLCLQNANTLSSLYRIPQDATIITDQTKFRQILYNLLSNACKFTKQGKITLTVEQDPLGDGYIFQVTDTGIGMSPAQLNKIFKAFMQADASITRRYGGTGLGLTLSQRFTQLLEGELSVESEKDQGTTFSLRLPHSIKQATAGTKRKKKKPKSVSFDQMDASWPLVLVIDDDDNVLDLLRRTLKKQGYRAITTASAQEGLSLVDTHKPDIITLDIAMPGMDGWGFLNALKSNEETRHIPVLVISITDDVERAFALGAAEYLTKPIDRRKLLKLIRQYKEIKNIPPITLLQDGQSETSEPLQRLNTYGWSVQTFENLRAGFQQFTKKTPSMFVVDLLDPQEKHFTVLDTLSLKDKDKEIPITLLLPAQHDSLQDEQDELDIHDLAYSLHQRFKQQLIKQLPTDEPVSGDSFESLESLESLESMEALDPPNSLDLPNPPSLDDIDDDVNH